LYDEITKKPTKKLPFGGMCDEFNSINIHFLAIQQGVAVSLRVPRMVVLHTTDQTVYRDKGNLPS